MNKLCICNKCGKVVKEGKKFLKIIDIYTELGIIIKKVICSNCEKNT
jgi:hypothetical protein